MIISTDKFGHFRLDGDVVDPHSESLSGRVGYYIDTSVGYRLEKYINGKDKAYKAGPNSGVSFTFYSDVGNFRALPSAVWTDADTEADVAADLEHFRNAIESEGWKWADTAGSLAGRICREYAPTKQLEPRWREMSHNAIHQGPMICAMGGAAHVVGWDREKAFLRALYEPMPAGGWIAVQPRSVGATRGMRGLVRATLRVEPSRYAGHIPPLPVRLSGYTVYPVGRVRGCWTLEMFFDAIDNGGYEIEEIHELCVCRAMPIHAKAADRIVAVKDKRLMKMLYTRYWGRLAATGGYEGYDSSRYPEPKHLLGSRLSWYYMGKSPMGHDCPPDYRPDHAAFISSANHVVMNKALRQYGPNEVIGTHVDCIWTNNLSVAPYASFREKHSGEARFYGVGCYRVGDAMAAQGYSGALTPETLETWGSGINGGNPVYREWSGLPQASADATSNPPVHTTEILARDPVRNAPDIYSEIWTSKGWVHAPEDSKINA